MQEILRAADEQLEDLTAIDALADILALHPSAPSEPFPAKPQAPRIIIPDEDKFDAALKAIDNGSAPGPSLWTPRLLSYIAEDQEAKKGLLAVMSRLLNGSLSPDLMSLFLASRLLAVPKMKEGARTGLRPIAVGDVFVRLAAKIGSLGLPSGQVLFPNNIQMGINIKGGPQSALHIIQTALQSNKNHVIICTDFANAYNSINRSKIGKAFLDNALLTDLHPLFHALYSQPAPLLIHGKDGVLHSIVSSDTGVRQGDPLSSLAYAMAVEPIYVEVQGKHRDTTVVAVQDDFYIIGPLRAAAEAYISLRTRVADPSLGLSLCASKCKLFHPSKTPPNSEELKKTAQDLGIQFIHGRLVVLGTPIGEDKDNITETLRGVVSEYIAKVKPVLTHKAMAPKIALTLVQKCVIPKMMHLARTLLPSLAADPFRHFDSLVFNLVTDMLKLPKNMSAPLRGHVNLPLKLGGLGIRSYTKIHRAAFAASLLESSVGTQRALQNIKITADLTPSDNAHCVASRLPSVKEAKAGLLELRNLAPDKIGALLPSRPTTHITGLPEPPTSNAGKLQSGFTAVIDDVTTREICNDAQHGHNGVLRKKLDLNKKNPLSRHFLTGSPAVICQALSNGDFCSAVRDFLYIPVLSDDEAPPDTKCPMCGYRTLGLPDHPVGCVGMMKKTGFTRHEGIVSFLVSTITSVANLTATKFARVEERSALAADLVFCHQAGWTFSDVSVVNPLAPSHLNENPGVSVKSREAVKTKKYASLVGKHPHAPEGSDFLAFVVDCNGTLGTQARKLLQRVAKYAVMFDPSYTEEGFIKFCEKKLYFLLIKYKVMMHRAFACHSLSKTFHARSGNVLEYNSNSFEVITQRALVGPLATPKIPLPVAHDAPTAASTPEQEPSEQEQLPLSEAHDILAAALPPEQEVVTHTAASLLEAVAAAVAASGQALPPMPLAPLLDAHPLTPTHTVPHTSHDSSSTVLTLPLSQPITPSRTPSPTLTSRFSPHPPSPPSPLHIAPPGLHTHLHTPSPPTTRPPSPLHTSTPSPPPTQLPTSTHVSAPPSPTLPSQSVPTHTSQYSPPPISFGPSPISAHTRLRSVCAAKATQVKAGNETLMHFEVTKNAESQASQSSSSLSSQSQEF
jgi:hypothetical protein